MLPKFTDADYESMKMDTVRNQVFSDELKFVSKTKTKVFDLGTGPIALLCTFAQKHGLKAIGIEANLRAAQRARQKGFDVRPLMAQDAATAKWLLEEKPDAIVCELIGFLASGEGMFSALAHVQANAPKALVLPSKVSTRYVVANIAKKHTKFALHCDQYTLAKSLAFKDVAASADEGILESFDTSLKLWPQLMQVRKKIFAADAESLVNALAFWIRAEFPGGGFFTSSVSDKPHNAKNWRNMVLWLLKPLDIKKGDSILVRTMVDAHHFPCRYSFEVTHDNESQTLCVDNMDQDLSSRREVQARKH